ncbi:helix-turn-helix domain-containing protein [Halobaculum litoreum]|uniref:Helix-turn-helix domain-containing protein n=1 Tax=Halobaculum litoreum TaxID=3031998 RepID=A0ABD5XS39_9EURY|nr:helix-turn-helix domain-containing protein [Halobaculum sp. DT92]
MKHVRLSITAGGHESAIHPMYGLLTGAPFVERATALQWNRTDGTLGVLHYVEGDAAAFDEAVGALDAVVEHALAPVDDGAFYAYVRDDTVGPVADLFAPLAAAGLVVVPPIRYRRDGAVELSVFGPSDAVGALVDALDPPVEVTVERVGGLTALAPATRRLSPRQREAVEAALAAGYYEVPRTGSQRDVAEALDCAPSTAAEHLRKAEATLVRTALERL